MNQSPTSVAQAFVRAVNRQNVDELANLMTTNHSFIDSLGGQTQGRETMRAGWTGYFRMVPDYTITVDESYCDGSIVVMLGTVGGTYSADGTLKEENRWRAPAVLRAVIEQEKVAEWRVYCDNEPMRQKIAKHV